MGGRGVGWGVGGGVGGGGGRGAVWAGQGVDAGAGPALEPLKQFSNTVWGGGEHATWRIGVGASKKVP